MNKKVAGNCRGNRMRFKGKELMLSRKVLPLLRNVSQIEEI